MVPCPLQVAEVPTLAREAFEPLLDEEIAMRAQIHYPAPTFLITGMCTALLMFSGVASAQEPLTTNQQKCINQVNKNFAKVASAQAKEICDCIKRGSKGLLSGETIEECATNDAKGKVDKAKQKTLTKESSSCGTPPDFGYTSGANANDTAMAKELAIIHRIFGSDLDTFVIDEFLFKNGAKCQQAVAKQARKCQDAKLKVFNGCKKDALKSKGGPAVTSAQELQDACLGVGGAGMPDPKGKIQKACVDKLGDTIDKKCTSKEGVSLSAVFPLFDPNGGSTLQAFVDRIIECEACKAINQADALNRDCDLFDDGVANESCL